MYISYTTVARDLWQRKPPLSSGYALGLRSVYSHKSLARAITITYPCTITRFKSFSNEIGYWCKNDSCEMCVIWCPFSSSLSPSKTRKLWANLRKGVTLHISRVFVLKINAYIFGTITAMNWHEYSTTLTTDCEPSPLPAWAGWAHTSITFKNCCFMAATGGLPKLLMLDMWSRRPKLLTNHVWRKSSWLEMVAGWKVTKRCVLHNVQIRSQSQKSRNLVWI